MIRVIPTHSKIGTIRATIIGWDGNKICDLTMLGVLQLKEGLEDWLLKVKNKEHQNK